MKNQTTRILYIALYAAGLANTGPMQCMPVAIQQAKLQKLQLAHELEQRAILHAEDAHRLRAVAQKAAAQDERNRLAGKAKKLDKLAASLQKKASDIHDASAAHDKLSVHKGTLKQSLHPAVTGSKLPPGHVIARSMADDASTPEERARTLLSIAHEELALGTHRATLLLLAKQLEEEAPKHMDSNHELSNELHYHSGQLREKYMTLDQPISLAKTPENLRLEARRHLSKYHETLDEYDLSEKHSLQEEALRHLREANALDLQASELEKQKPAILYPSAPWRYYGDELGFREDC